MSRGNERRPIVRDDIDRHKRLDWLRRTVETYGWRLHAFALMTNHEHLFVETPEANLSAGMQYLGGSYTSYFNRRRGRRVDDASRAVATYLARRCFGYSASQVAAVLGYRSHGGVSNAIVRIESAGPGIKRTAEKLARKLH